MKIKLGIIIGRLSIVTAIATLIAAGGTQSSSAAGTTTWSGAGGANQNWSASANWTTVGGGTPPGVGQAVIFKSTGAGPDGTVNNIVDAGFTAAIGGLLFTNDTANVFHTTQIPTGNTLTVDVPITVGTNNQLATYTITGGGTLRGGNGTSVFTVAGGANNVTNDLSGLSNFIWNSGGAGGNFNIGLDLGVPDEIAQSRKVIRHVV